MHSILWKSPAIRSSGAGSSERVAAGRTRARRSVRRQLLHRQQPLDSLPRLEGFPRRGLPTAKRDAPAVRNVLNHLVFGGKPVNALNFMPESAFFACEDSCDLA